MDTWNNNIINQNLQGAHGRIDNGPQCATINLEAPIPHGAWPSQSLHNVVTDPGSFKLTDISYRLRVSLVRFSFSIRLRFVRVIGSFVSCIVRQFN